MKKTLADALAAKGYDTLTAVQEACLNPEVEGRDLLVSAQTGSGKTIGFGLAIAPQILGDEDRFDRAGAPLALVIAPTRELALQVKRELDWLYKAAGAVVVSTVGGMDMRDERRALDRGSHIVVATPGRLLDLFERGSLLLRDVKILVIDEADRILEIGFEEEMRQIVKLLPKERQTMLFSATQTTKVEDLARLSFRKAPIYIGVDDSRNVSTREGLEQGYCVVSAELRFMLLFTFLKKNMGKKVSDSLINRVFLDLDTKQDRMIAQDEEEDYSEIESVTPDIEPYDFKNLPEHSCVYCGVHEERCVVKCKSKNCNKWFCNGKG